MQVVYVSNQQCEATFYYTHVALHASMQACAGQAKVPASCRHAAHDTSASDHWTACAHMRPSADWMHLNCSCHVGHCLDQDHRGTFVRHEQQDTGSEAHEDSYMVKAPLPNFTPNVIDSAWCCFKRSRVPATSEKLVPSY